MKKKILSLLAAFFMLFGTSAMAQVDSTLEGDVNGDGVVDIADITAVIAIIKQNAEANPTYYWYFGTEKLTTDAQIESKGTKISENDIGVLRTEKVLTPGISPEFFDDICGATLKCDVSSGEGVLLKHFI